MNIKRREFFKMIAGASTAYYTLSLAACGPAERDGSSLRVDVKDGDTVVIYDMVCEGYSTFGDGGYLGPSGALKAQAVKDNKAITLPYIQDDDGHTFTLTPEHFAKLRQGQAISVITTEANYHTHEVRIDPKHKVPGSQGLTVPVNGDPAGAAATSEKAYAGLTDADKNLYVTSTADLDEASVQYCADTVAKCDADPNAWQSMARYAKRSDRQIFVSTRELALDASQTELPLNIKAKAKKDGSALRFALKFVRK